MKQAIQLLFISLFICVTAGLYGETSIDFETGIASASYNNIRIPGNTGTGFSLCEDLSDEDPMFFRLSGEYSAGGPHSFSILIAPLTIRSEGSLDKDIVFGKETFTAGSGIDAVYTFNSYRFTWRYRLYDTEKYEFGIGATLKIRDAEIGLKSGAQEYIKEDLGFVPLVNLKYLLHLSPQWDFQISGDALAAPQGRAEDILFAGVYKAGDRVKLRFGYRILEGGADNDEVYTFSMIHYAVFGLYVRI